MTTADYFSSVYRDYTSQNPPEKLDHYLDVIASRLPNPHTRLLDVGCGQGLFLARTSIRFPDWDLSGIDTNESGIRTTSDLVQDATLKKASAEGIPFASNSFDVATAWDVLEHVPDLGMAFSEIQRCLKPGGLLALVVPVYDGITGPLVRALDRDPSHVHKKPRDFWVDIISQRFSQVEWHGIYRYLVTKTKYLHRPTSGLRRHSPAILVSAVRR